MRMRKLISVLLLLSFSFAACAGVVDMELPAVSDGEGILVDIEMRGIPGSGMEYVGAEPTVGTATQESLSAAADVARELSGDGRNCDLLVRVSDGTPGGVEGPSAGAAFAVMAYSLFTGEGYREDATITGGITEDGIVVPVGGLYEKAVSAKRSGKDYFITPLQSVEEKLMLRAIEGIEIREVEGVGEAVAFFFEGKVPEVRPLELEVEPLENLTPYEGERVPEMGAIVEALIEGEKEAVSGIGEEAVREYFEAKAGQHEEVYALGYDYAAANGAFLTQISASAIAEVGEPDLEGNIKEVEECLDSLDKPELTMGNFQWVMGGEAREMRARRNYEKYIEYEPETKDEEYLLVYQMGYSRAWCSAAKAMYGAGKNEGAGEDEAKLKEIAEGLLNYTEDYGEWQEYADTGEQLYGKGLYAGAVYELLFAKSMHQGNGEMDEGATEGDYEEMMGEERTSVWGKVFRGHASYLKQQGSDEDAYRMAVFAENMDEAVGQVGASQEVIVVGGEEEECVCETNICMPAFLVLLVLATVGRKG